MILKTLVMIHQAQMVNFRFSMRDLALKQLRQLTMKCCGNIREILSPWAVEEEKACSVGLICLTVRNQTTKNTQTYPYCIVFEHLYSASHSLTVSKRISVQLAPRKQTGFKKS